MTALGVGNDGTFHVDLRVDCRRHRRIPGTEVRDGPPTPLLSDLIRVFLLHQAGKRKEKTIETQRRHLGRFLAGIGDLSPGEIRPGHILTFLDGVAAHPATWNRYRTSLHRFFEHALLLDEIAANPVKKIRPPREEKKPPRVLTASQRDALLRSVSGTSLEVPIALAALAGLRREEICRLLWADIDREKGRLLVRRAKSKRFRVVPIARSLDEILARARRTASPFVALRGEKPWDPDNLTTYVKRAGKRSGLDQVLRGPHTLRETFASLLAEAGENLYRIRDWLGHSSIAVTERYAHLLPGRRGKIDEV